MLAFIEASKIQPGSLEHLYPETVEHPTATRLRWLQPSTTIWVVSTADMPVDRPKSKSPTRQRSVRLTSATAASAT